MKFGSGLYVNREDYDTLVDDVNSILQRVVKLENSTVELSPRDLKLLGNRLARKINNRVDRLVDQRVDRRIDEIVNAIRKRAYTEGKLDAYEEFVKGGFKDGK